MSAMEAPVNRLVLIADGNTGRGRRLAEACEGAGIPCRSVPHGAAALETALAERPGLVVAQVDLPLVDAAKLAEILRANPRTQSAGFLFLGEGDGLVGRVGDVSLPACARPDEVLGMVEGLIEKQQRISRLSASADSGDAIEGELAELAPAELLQLLYGSRKSGRLDLRRSDENGNPERGRIHLRDGDVIQAETGSVDGEKALFRLLRWTHGHFFFDPGRGDQTPSIVAPTRALLAEGLRQRDEWDRLALKLPSLDAQVRLQVRRGDLPNIVHPLTQEVMILLELYGRVGDVVDHCAFPDYQVLRTLGTLAEREIIALGAAPLPPPSVEAEALWNEAQARRLREWLREGREGGEGATCAKLLVASADPDATPDFANLLLAAGGTSLSDEMARGQLGPNDLATLGRVAVDGETAIELIHVPLDPRFAPLWTLAGHGALGTLFLLGSNMSEAAERVRGMSDALRQLPRSRIFHVVLLQQGERVSPDELRDNLSLLDEASLCLLPLTNGQATHKSLRNLFSRVVP